MLLHPLDDSVYDAVDFLGVQPAAGANYTVDLSANCRSEIAYVTFRLVTAVAAANRYARLQIDVAGVPIITSVCIPPIPASTTAWLSFQSGGPLCPAALPPNIFVAIGFGAGIKFDDQVTVRIIVTNIQAADQISFVAVGYKRWPFPGYALP